MYSPKIAERLIPPLYRLRCERKQPMTHIVAEAIEQYLVAAGALTTDDDAAAQHSTRPDRRAA